jgi:hypothetical protein
MGGKTVAMALGVNLLVVFALDAIYWVFTRGGRPVKEVLFREKDIVASSCYFY